ncbi:MAG: helix-turn-helix domain-containing protein [Candidatus Bathyarchaeota archaeon]|nr:helix-turn-helix domain-containing protein [Candidatus Bathyarchaeota archaeon]
MTYLQLINRFWDADRASPFSPCETRLYMLLLDAANRKGWNAELPYTKEELAERLDVAATTFLRARRRLSEAGLITYAENCGGRKKRTVYTIADAPKKGSMVKPFTAEKGIEKGIKNDTVYATLSEQKGSEKGSMVKPFTPIDIDLSSYRHKDYIVEEKENYSKEKIPHGISAFAPEEEISDVVAQLKDEGAWGESVCMKFRLSPDSLTDLLDEYRLHCMTIGEERKTVKDAKRHFTNWLRAKARSEKTDRHETDRKDNRSAGRDERDAAFRSYVINKLSNGDGG